MFERNVTLKKEKGNIPYWQIAEKIGVHENTVIRWFRTEMDPNKKREISNAIQKVREETKLYG